MLISYYFVMSSPSCTPLLAMVVKELTMDRQVGTETYSRVGACF